MYRVNLIGTITNLDNGSLIPIDIGNHDYNEYLEWVEKGGIPEQEIAPVLPRSVTMRQAQLALFKAGIYNDVEDTISLLGPPAVIWWRTSPTVENTNELVLQIKELLGWTDQQLDDLFTLAESL